MENSNEKTSYLKKLHEKDHVQEDLVKIRKSFFYSEGWYADDSTVLKWYQSRLRLHPTSKEYIEVIDILKD